MIYDRIQAEPARTLQISEHQSSATGQSSMQSNADGDIATYSPSYWYHPSWTLPMQIN